MKKIFLTILSLTLISLSLSGCSKNPSSLVADYDDAVSSYERCLAEQNTTCKDDSKKLAIELYKEIDNTDLELGFFNIFDIKNEREKKLKNKINTANAKMTKTLFADSDYNQAATFYIDTNGMFEKQESVNMLGILIKHISSISDYKKRDLAEIAESYKMPYETFEIKLSYETYPYYAATSIIAMLEKYNCYADAALFTNYFIKYDNSLYNELNTKYEEIMSNISREDIKTLNEKTRNIINNDQKPSLSSDCELNFYKKLK